MSDSQAEDNRKRGGKQDGGKKSKKAKYIPNTSSTAAIPAAAIGILVTCDNYFEFKATREALMLIEEHYDKVAGKNGTAAASTAPGTSGTKDISALLAEEVADLNDKSKHRFKKHDTGVKGCFFVGFPAESGPAPLDVVLSILREAKSTQQLRARNCARFLPITHSSHCSLEAIQELAPKVLEGQFPPDKEATCTPFSVEYEHRSSDKLDRMEVINAFATRISCPPHKVSLTKPEKTILVQLVRNACGCAVVTEYHELSRYNIKTVTGFQDKGQAGNQKMQAPSAAKPADVQEQQVTAEQQAEAQTAAEAAMDKAGTGEQEAEANVGNGKAAAEQ